MKTIGRLLLLGWFFLIFPPSGGFYAVGRYNSQRGCRDWLGSCLYHHSPACHKDPTPANCAPDGPGFGDGFCSSDCYTLLNPGWYFIDGDFQLHGRFGRQSCAAQSAKCFFVGNTGE